MVSFLKTAACAAIVVLVAACASSHVLVGKARPPISPDQVKVYLHAPAKYEEIAILDASSKNSLAITSQGKMNKVIERLKTEAAALGANGILLKGTGDQYVGSVNTSSANATAVGNSAYGTGFGTSAAIMQKEGSGLAIYVTQE